MKKVIIPFDGSDFSKSALNFAFKLNKLKPLFLTGLFLPDYSEMYYYVGFETITLPPLMFLPEHHQEKEINESVNIFRNFCIENGIDYSIYKGTGEYGLYQLNKESRYADLIIINSERFYPENNKTESSLTNILEGSESSVLLIPEHGVFPDNIILAYDGSKSSVHALKQFAYLCPELCDKKTTLVYADKNEKHMLPNLQKIKEWATHHFSNLTFYKLEADPTKYFETWLMEVENPLLISGAYNRSALSRLFKKSFAENFIHEHKIPIFVSHF